MKSIQRCSRRFAETHANEVARLLELSPAADTAPYMSALPVESAARVLGDMSIASGAEILSLMDIAAAAALTNQLPFDNAVPLLRRLPPERRSGVLAGLPAKSGDHLERLLEYPDGTVGAVTDPQVLSIPSNFSIDEAQRLFRKRVGAFHHQVYVVDGDRKLLGYMHVRELLRASVKAPVTSIMVAAPVCLSADTRLANTLHHRAWTQIDAIPVIDKSGVLLGIVRHRQLRQLQAVQETGGISNAILGLSELYWIGLANFLRGGVGDAKSTYNAPAAHPGGNNAA